MNRNSSPQLLRIVGGYGNGGGKEHTAYFGLGGEF
jgi:trimeric autotransporter adhesin